jgi:hypothetical protein
VVKIKTKKPTKKKVTFSPEGAGKVSVSLGFKLSRNYQTVSADVSVEVPVEAGQESKGLDYAAEQADEWLRKNETGIDEYLEELVCKAQG